MPSVTSGGSTIGADDYFIWGDSEVQPAFRPLIVLLHSSLSETELDPNTSLVDCLPDLSSSDISTAHFQALNKGLANRKELAVNLLIALTFRGSVESNDVVLLTASFARSIVSVPDSC